MGSSKPDVEQGQHQSLPWTQQDQRAHHPDQQQVHYPAVDQSPAYYGTFHDQPGFPQPVPPSQAPHYAQGDSSYMYDQARGIHGRIVEGKPLLSGEHFHSSDPLPFCGLGFGWFLFIFGFFCVIPWYIGTAIFFCLKSDPREHTGLLACAIAALICLLAGGSKFGDVW
ncbi:hypothetical protein MPTK1_3g23780 [Marchantia polymorpha subsp. ruderalis]|uniref:60S ribosomal protein L18a-like protein n=2 Tax=Marchantia polymorpha TaxID=3197 RepID=A0AAF6B436_MARPO|nr:hypothetical protein MARPO_0121s0045 [Marchantia polymorpha]BBN06770.1 hypothetical protein Mp_3g23780 [Marchantia polymorpha subsp. ruderalis]|eukprot:PTQ30706.1 hypothetical protein MARPO_0121s0045 [Marchantia polymorpha]